MNETTQVLIADDDPSFRRFVAQALEGTEFDAIDVTLDPASLTAPNVILILGGTWTNELLTGAVGGQQAVLVVADTGSAEEVERAMRAGADDTLVKPLPPAILLARLRVARHRLTQSTAQSPRRCLEDALAKRLTGSVIVRSPESGGAIHVHDGKISWVERRGHTTSLLTMLANHGIDIDADTCDAVLREARSLDLHFTSILADWHVCSEAEARNVVRAHVAEELEQLLNVNKASVMFAPYDAWRAGKLAFEVDEVLPASAPNSGLVPSSRMQVDSAPQTTSKFAIAAFRAARKLPGCVAASLFDRSGTLLGRHGEDVDPQLAWHIVQMMRPPGRSLTVEDHAHVHFARPLDETAVLLATFSLQQVTLGMARMSLAQACTRPTKKSTPSLRVGALPRSVLPAKM